MFSDLKKRRKPVEAVPGGGAEMSSRREEGYIPLLGWYGDVLGKYYKYFAPIAYIIWQISFHSQSPVVNDGDGN